MEFPKIVQIKAIQFLSHQYNIATKIEIFIRAPGSEKFKKIGYLSLDSNERSNFQARELKTVYPDYQASQIKFNLLRCHTNSHNIYAQVGLIAVNILGELNKNENPLGNDSAFDKLEDEMIYDPATLKRLKDLLRAKKRAVELEDFDEAKKIKYAIDNLKSVSQSLIQLEERKKIAIKNDDFDSAKLIKYEIERLRNAVAGLNIAEMNQRMAEERPREEYPREYQQEEPEPIPEGNKMNLYANKQHSLQPINSEYEMDKNEDLYRFQNNINEGYHLESNNPPMEENYENEPQPDFRQHQNPSNNFNNIPPMGRQNESRGNPMKINKPVVDVDSLAVKGISKDWNTIVEEQMNDDPMGGGGKAKGQIDAEQGEIPAAEYKIAEPLIPILTFPLVQMIFSPQWKVKEDGFKALSDELNSYPNSKILGNHTEEEVMNACLGACAHTLTSNISQALLSAMDLLKVLFNKFRTYSSQGYSRSDFDRYVNESVRLLIEHLGDTNIKLKERAESTLLECANFNLIGSRLIFEHIISGQIKKNLKNSWKHLQGRYNFLARLIGNFGYNSSEVPLNTIMGYAIKGYTNQQNTVREAALEVIKSVYRYEGDKVRPYFKELRPAQINTIEDALSSIDGLDEEIATGKNNFSSGIGPSTKGTNLQSEAPNEMEMGNEMVNNSQMLSGGGNQSLMGENPNTCQFCGLFDINFTEDSLAMHQYKECVMLIQCFKCGNIVEISGLNNHYLNECPQKKQFKQCPRCKEAVLVKDYDKHVSDKFCNQAKSPNMANRCPLCHNDITPSGKIGWDTHLIHQGCPNNPRTSGY
ncbi:MAG: hypothetical protein MJ252_13010 [archaeon]|nr:hypothetical protein [archaeon]